MTDFWFPHQVLIRSPQSRGGIGTGHGASRPVKAEVRDEQRLVRNIDGVEVVSSTQVTVPITTTVPLGSLVTVWAGTSSQREAEVLSVSREQNGDDLDSFLVLSLT